MMDTHHIFLSLLCNIQVFSVACQNNANPAKKPSQVKQAISASAI